MASSKEKTLDVDAESLALSGKGVRLWITGDGNEAAGKLLLLPTLHFLTLGLESSNDLK